jgi:hypothetical protein
MYRYWVSDDLFVPRVVNTWLTPAGWKFICQLAGEVLAIFRTARSSYMYAPTNSQGCDEKGIGWADGERRAGQERLDEWHGEEGKNIRS